MDQIAQPSSPARAPHESLCGLLAWVGGGLTTAFQPARLAAGFIVVLLVWLPGLGWDALTGPGLDAAGFTSEPYDDAEHAAVQGTLRRIAAEYAPDTVFETARLPAAELAAILEARAAGAPDARARDALLAAAARVGAMAPVGSFEALMRAKAVAAGLIVDGVCSFNAPDVAQGFRMAVWATPQAVWQRDPVFAVVFGLWCVLVFAVGAGALARMEAAQVAGAEPRALDGFRFAAEHWASLVLAWLAPVGIAAVLGLACVAWGALFAGGWSGWLGAALYIVPLAVGSVAGLALVVGALGAMTAPAAVACDGLDALDASQRGALYAIGRPGLWAAVLLTVALVAAAGLVVVRVVAWAMTGFTATAVSLGASLASDRGGAVVFDAVRVTPGDMPVVWGGPGVVVAWWVALASVVVAGAFLSLLAGLLTRAYLALRERCDGQPRTDIWPFEIAADVSDAAARPTL